jgi:NAD(P)-dependent dehydrogenase (short-subunit alcohol dehydrogenase family)
MTDKQLNLWVDEAGLVTRDQNQCLPGDLKSIDVANLAMFLAADDSQMCTAQEFVVDGGWT